MIEEVLNGLIRLGKAGKIKAQPYPDLKKVISVCKKHAKQDLIKGMPFLPEDWKEWLVGDVIDTVLHTDILVNRMGWVIALDWTVDASAVPRKIRKLKGVSTALSQLGVDRAVIVVVKENHGNSQVQWEKQLDAVIKAASTIDNFVSDGEIIF